MAQVCYCGSLMCPICKGRPPGVAQSETPNVRRNKGRRERPIYESGKAETPNVLRQESEVKVWEHVTSGESRALLAGDVHLCPTCGRPYCPECGNPIPVRGDYCKPACRVKAWRKKKAE